MKFKNHTLDKTSNEYRILCSIQRNPSANWIELLEFHGGFLLAQGLVLLIKAGLVVSNNSQYSPRFWAVMEKD